MFNKQIIFYTLLLTITIIQVIVYSHPDKTYAYDEQTEKTTGEGDNHSKSKVKSTPKYSQSQRIFRGKVASVPDGNTIKILSNKPFPLNYLKKIKVKLAGIDAPEKAQANGKDAKKALANLVAGKVVTVVEVHRDKEGTILGHVNVHGVDVNTEMVRMGYAWVHKKYVNNTNLYKLEDNAKEAKLGLWAEPDPVPPWEWRKARR